MTRTAHLFVACLLVLLSWGALAFGAEYSWAYAPLLVLCVVAATLAARLPRGGRPPALRALCVALFVLFVAGALLLVPASAAIRAGVRSDAPAVDYDRLFTEVTMLAPPRWQPSHALSIAPARTFLGLAFLASLAALLIGCISAFGTFAPQSLVTGVTFLGVAVAFIGIAQAGAPSKEIYGFWRSPVWGAPFAPFINPNHFCGWMVMVMSLAMGRFAGDVATSMRNVNPGWRTRILWLASRHANRMILTTGAMAIMALSVIVTLSRGGLLGLMTAGLIQGLWLICRQPSKLRRAIGTGILVGGFLVVAIQGGAAQTLGQFRADEVDWGGRRDIWLDASRIIRDHLLTGTGLNTFGIAMLHYQSGLPHVRVIEAHNDYLQLAAEGGLLLGIPILATLGIVVWEIRNRFQERGDDSDAYWLRVGAVTGLGAIAVMEVFDFTLQMPGAAAMFVVLIAVAIHRPGYLGNGGNNEADATAFTTIQHNREL